VMKTTFMARHRNLIQEIVAFLFVLLLVYAAGSKIMDLQKFSVQIGQSTLVTNMSGFVSWFIPIFETITPLLLAIPKYRLPGLYGSFALMTMFTAYIIAILNFSTKIPCSCGGVLELLGWKEHLVFNIVFVILAGIGRWLQSASGSHSKKKLLPIGEPSPS